MSERRDGGADTGVRSTVITKTKPKTQKPAMYRVLILNDDYTPMEFVVYVLEQFFNKSRDQATQIMLHTCLLHFLRGSALHDDSDTDNDCASFLESCNGG